MKRRRLKRKYFCHRVIAAIILALLIIVFIGSFCVKPRGSTKLYEEYVIMPGDTLHSLAYDIYGDSCDLRYKVKEIAKESGITNPDMIHPGDVVLLPVE